MATDAQGHFVLDLSPKQFEIMRLCRLENGLKKYIFVNGPKKTGKSIGCWNAVVDHAWNTKDARVCVIASSITAGDDAGVWTELVEKIIPQWIGGDFGLKWWKGKKGQRYVEGARQKGTSKKLYCEITNKHGGKSTIQLDSLKDERDVEKDFFNRYFTMIYWSELQNFKEYKTFVTLTQALRAPGLPEDQFVLLCDGNPSDMGTNSPWYKLFFEDRISDDLPEDRKPMQKHLHLIIVTMDDNPYLTDEQKLSNAAEYASDPDLHARYVLGEWKQASTDALFVGVFKPSIHVLGDAKDNDPEIILPSDGCHELKTGWDFGGANPAMVIFEKCMTQREGQKHEQSVFHFLDELVFIKEQIGVSEFTEMVLRKMNWLELQIGGPVDWQHWSDVSAFNHREPISQRYQHEEVYAVSGGRILLRAVEHGRNTVGPRIRLWRKLLFQERILMSAVKCPKLIEMCQAIRRKKLIPDSVTDGSPHKHVLDAATYALSRECYEELQDNIISLHTTKKSESELISVAL